MAPFNSVTPHSPNFPTFRTTTSSVDTASPTVVSPLDSSSSAVDELVNSLNQETETELRNDRLLALDGKSNGDLISRNLGTEETRMEQCSAEPPPSCTSSQNCPICNGICTDCRVPANFDSPTRNKLFKFGHLAHQLERMASNETLRQWIEPLKFASYSWNTTEGESDVCCMSWEYCKRQIECGSGFGKPAIISESFADRAEWTPSRYADLLELAFEGTQVDIKWHQSPQPERVPVSRLVDLLRCQSSAAQSENPPNVLNLPEITDAVSPSFLRIDRFRLLNLVMERCRANFQQHIGKQVHLTAFDIGSCRKFNILGWPGAFSGPHVDSSGATWVRNLFGHKLWMFVPKPAMDPEDWERFAKDGDRWDPRGKGRGVILEPGDVFVMEPGLIHAVYTLGDTEPCLMTGGMFFDQSDLMHSLENLFWVGKNQNATNEPIAYQLAQLISTVEELVERKPRRWFASSDDLLGFRQVIKSLRSLGCTCEDCDNECRCSMEGRRCTPLCAAHYVHESIPFSCMLEVQKKEDNASDSENSDEEYIE